MQAIDYPFRDERHIEASRIVEAETGLLVRFVPGTDPNVTAREIADEFKKALANIDDWALDELD